MDKKWTKFPFGQNRQNGQNGIKWLKLTKLDKMWNITKDKTHKLDSIALDRIKKINNGQKLLNGQDEKFGQDESSDKINKN